MKRVMLMASVVLLPLLGCQTDMAHIQKGDINSTQRVLIAGTSSDFKQKVTSRIIEAQELQPCYFNVIGLNGIDKVATEPYQVILFITAYTAGKIDGRVKEFLQKDPLNPKVIVFYTIGDEDHPPSGRNIPDIKVDAVASASLTSRIEERAHDVVALIVKRFISN